MLLAHRIRLDPTPVQREYFARAAGTARRVWNWALAEWQRQIAAGQRPNAMGLKRQFNTIKYSHPDWLGTDGQPWLRTVHKDAHAQPFANLAKAWSRYFAALCEHRPAHRPVFKKKGRCRDSFYVANDKLRMDGKRVVLPKVGPVALREPLRWPGRIMGASVGREADHWFLALQVEVPERVARLRRSGDGITGVDLGVSSAATLSSGEKIAAPRPLKAALRRLRIRNRRLSRKVKAAKKAAGISGPIPKGVRFPVSANRRKGARALARLHAPGWRGRLPMSVFMNCGVSSTTRPNVTARRWCWPTAGTHRASSVRAVVRGTVSWAWVSATGPVTTAGHNTTGTSTRRSIWNGSQPAPLRRTLRYPWRVRRQRRALPPTWGRREAGKSRLSDTSTVSKTARDRNKTMLTIEHFF
jgi:putative transposase